MSNGEVGKRQADSHPSGRAGGPTVECCGSSSELVALMQESLSVARYRGVDDTGSQMRGGRHDAKDDRLSEQLKVLTDQRRVRDCLTRKKVAKNPSIEPLALTVSRKSAALRSTENPSAACSQFIQTSESPCRPRVVGVPTLDRQAHSN